jgi:hypothetical protein
MGAAKPLTVQQPKPADRKGTVLRQDKNLQFDPYSDDRRSADDLYGPWPSYDRNRLSLSLPTRSEFDDLMKMGRRQGDLYQDWLDLTAAETFHHERVQAADKDFISPGSYDLLGMECDFIVCKIPHTSCAIALFPPLGACSF